MRLISQDGMTDVSYDKAILGICDPNNGQEYVIYTYHDSPRPLFIATYSNIDKALKVMEMLREQYFNNKHEETYRDGVFDYAPNFKFPDDSEIEV